MGIDRIERFLGGDLWSARRERRKITVDTLVQLPSKTVPVEDIAGFNRFLTTNVENSAIRLRAELLAREPR